jgi:hypothetical protein
MQPLGNLELQFWKLRMKGEVKKLRILNANFGFRSRNQSGWGGSTTFGASSISQFATLISQEACALSPDE